MEHKEISRQHQNFCTIFETQLLQQACPWYCAVRNNKQVHPPLTNCPQVYLQVKMDGEGL